jgi:PiT family inorganic phosphate transporter
MGWNIGANDVANAMGTSVGSKALTFKQAVVIAAVFEFGGAVFVGGRVTDTVRKGIVDPATFADNPDAFVLGMACSLLAAAIWLNIATIKGWPVSTTHSIVGAVVGFGIVYGGVGTVNWAETGLIVASWVVSPLCGGIISAMLFILIRHMTFNSEEPLKGLIRITPLIVGLVGYILTLSMIYKGLKALNLDLSFGQASLYGFWVGSVGAVITYLFVVKFVKSVKKETREEQFEAIEAVFGVLMIITAGYVAFSHGANDVANAIGPLAAIVSVSQSGISEDVAVPLWVLVLGGSSIVIGLMTFGYRVMETIGKKITDITPSRGFTATFGAATTVLVGSKMGLPLSTTHTMVGAVIGVGLVQGMAALDSRVIGEIFKSWVITLPFAGGLCALLFWFFSLILF